MERSKVIHFLRSTSKLKDLERDTALANRDVKNYLREIRSFLPDREYRVLVHRLINKKSFAEITKIIATEEDKKEISRQRVAEIEKRAYERLDGLVRKSPHKLPEISLDDNE